MRLDVTETSWAAKQRIIQTLAKVSSNRFLEMFCCTCECYDLLTIITVTSQKLSDPLNYGLYCKKLGRFLLDHKPLSDYVTAGSVAAYEVISCYDLFEFPATCFASVYPVAP